MAYAYDTYTATTSQMDFTITFPYIETSHVKVYVNGVLQTEGAGNDYTIVTSTICRFGTGLSSGDIVEIIRSTSAATRIVDYTSASSLTEDDLDNDSLQAFYMAQEAIDDGDESHLKKTYNDYWDFESLPSINVPTPSLPGEVANKSYVDDYAAGAGNVPIPDNPTDDGKFIRANAATFGWVTLITSMVTDIVSVMRTFITSANLADARGNLGLGSAAVEDIGTTSGTIPTLNADGGLTFTDTDAGAGEGPNLDLYRDSASPAAADSLGTLRYLGNDDAAASVTYAEIRGRIDDPAAASTDSALRFITRNSSGYADRMVVSKGVIIAGPTGGDQGVGTLNATGIYRNGVELPRIDAVQTWTAGQRGEVTALTDGANISLDLALSNNFSVTLAGNRTLDNPTNIVVGQSGLIVVTQDATGTRTLAYGTYYKFAGGTAPTLTTTASAVDTLAYYVKSSTEILVSASLDWS